MKSYPLIERGGVLWTYMGPPEQQPPLPEWEFATVPASHSFMSKRLQESNWLQAMEGGIDSSHVSFLHSGELNSDPLFNTDKDGTQIFVNLANIVTLQRVTHGGDQLTEIIFVGGGSIWVKEPPSQIIDNATEQ